MTTSKYPYPQNPKNHVSLPVGDPVEKSPAPLGQGDLSTGSTPKIIYPYGPKRRVQLSFPTEGRTKQSFRDECDINIIMSRYLKTGVLEHVKTSVAQYLDVTGADFTEAQNLVAGAQTMFHMLPSHIRTKFDNNPAEFLKFMENPANAPEAQEMGLLATQRESGYPPSGASSSAQPAPSSQAPEASKAGGTPAPSEPAKPVVSPTNT